MRYILVILISILFFGCASGKYSMVEKYMLQNYLVAKLNGKEIYIDETSLHVKGDYALLQSPPMIKDGSDAYEYFLDAGYNVCLKKDADKWIVIYDLTRSDVPDKLQWKDIIQTFPKEFPRELLSEFWQKGLK